MKNEKPQFHSLIFIVRLMRLKYLFNWCLFKQKFPAKNSKERRVIVFLVLQAFLYKNVLTLLVTKAEHKSRSIELLKLHFFSYGHDVINY